MFTYRESLSQNLQFADLALDSADTAHFLAAINTGHVAHILSSGSRAHPALYQPDWGKNQFSLFKLNA